MKNVSTKKIIKMVLKLTFAKYQQILPFLVYHSFIIHIMQCVHHKKAHKILMDCFY